MKILHTSDWHLGIDLHKYSLIEDQRFFLQSLKEIIQSQDIDVVLIAGDIYDTTLASKEAIEVFNEAMQMLCIELKKKVIIIAGNHDSQTRLATCSELLKSSGLYIYGKIEEKIHPLTIDDVDFFPIPYFHKDSVARIYEQELMHYEDAFSCIMKDIERQRTKRKQIILAHCFVQGASVCESDRFAMLGGSDVVNVEVFKNVDYVALGHLHNPQKIAHHVRYSGSPLAYSFSEVTTKKVWIIDSDTMNIEACEVPIMRELKQLQGNYEDIIEKLPEYRDAYVKIQLENQHISYELLSFFRERVPYLLSLQASLDQTMISTQELRLETFDKASDIDIVKQFFLDYEHRELSEMEITWLMEAIEGCENEN